MINETNSIGDDFNWGNTQDGDFFSQVDAEETDSLDSKEVLKNLDKDNSEEDDTNKDKKTPVVSKEEDLFGKVDVSETDDEEEEEDDEDDKGTKVSVKTPNTFLLTQLKEKGFLDFELEEGEELTEELAEELLEDKFDESVDNKVKQLMGDLPEDKQEVIQYLLKGGSVAEFVNSLYESNAEINVEADLSSEASQISEMRKLLSLEDKDDEEIETEIEFLKDSGKLKLMVDKKMNKYKEGLEESKAELFQRQQKQIEDTKKAIKESKTKVATFLTENQEIDGLQFSKEDKRELPTFMNDRAIKLQNGNTITEMQKILFYDIPKNEKANIQLAALLKNRNEDGTFNFDALKTKARTQVANEVRDGIRRNRKSIPVSSKNKSDKAPKGLADYFNN